MPGRSTELSCQRTQIRNVDKKRYYERESPNLWVAQVLKNFGKSDLIVLPVTSVFIQALNYAFSLVVVQK